MITENCLVGCKETHHHANCSEYTTGIDYVKPNFLEAKQVIARAGYANLISTLNVYTIIETYKQQYRIQCDNGKVHNLSKKLFYSKI
jgi:hypothetical protein